MCQTDFSNISHFNVLFAFVNIIYVEER